MRTPSAPTKRAIVAFSVLALAGVSLASCHAPGTRDGFTDAKGGQAPAIRGVPGVETGAIRSATGCLIEYRLYRPEGRESRGLVVLAHGFMRSKERMDGLARALADAGMTTASLDLCNQRLWDGRHFQNGLDMRDLALRLGTRPVVYAGFSAGALAALVAGRQDPDAAGIVALDLVDDGELGLRMAGGLDKPLVGFMGEPSACNASASGMTVFAASRLGSVERIRGAGHCDFESPSDWLCARLCARPTDGPSDLRETIIASTVAAVTRLVGEPEESVGALAVGPGR